MPYPQFDRSRLHLLPLSDRHHDLHLNMMLDPEVPAAFTHPSIDALGDWIRQARENQRPVILMMGGHVIRAGVAPLLIRLMRAGYITLFAMNGSACIHDFELAMIGATTESVARYIKEGQFGLWQDNQRFNDAVNQGVKEGLGFGEALGRYVVEHAFPHQHISLMAAAYQAGIPVTGHVGLGCDIVHQLPNADGSAIGEGSYRDFLVFTHQVESLEGGVFLNFGSAVTGPEVYLKALAMARNVKKQTGESIRHFATGVFDLLPLEREDYHVTPPKSDPRYYFRPWKTILARTVADGGVSYYIQGEHRDTIPALHHALLGGVHADP